MSEPTFGIYIPSYKRAKTCTAHRFLQYGTYIVRESEEAEYREVLKEKGQIHFKTDNRDLFEWSLTQFPQAGFELSEVTRDLHANGICGVMTDYEEKFHNLGTPINRCVGTMGELPPEPPKEEPEAEEAEEEAGE